LYDVFFNVYQLLVKNKKITLKAKILLKMQLKIHK